MTALKAKRIFLNTLHHQDPKLDLLEETLISIRNKALAMQNLFQAHPYLTLQDLSLILENLSLILSEHQALKSLAKKVLKIISGHHYYIEMLIVCRVSNIFRE